MPVNTTKIAERIDSQLAYQIGREAFCYFYPLITMHITKQQMTNLPAGHKPGFGPPNQFSHMPAYPSAELKVVVRPNFDTLYSSAWLDLTKEPVIVSIPEMAGRYYLLPMLDMWTDVFASPGWRTSGTAAQHFLVAAPQWSGTTPGGVERIDAPTPFIWIIGRIKTDGPDDYEKVHELQNGLSITPLSAWGRTCAAAEAAIDPSVDMSTPPLDLVNKMPKSEYFALAAELLKLNKPHKTDWSTLTRLKHIGFEVGKTFNLEELDPGIKDAFVSGATDALELLTAKVNSMGRQVNGWLMNTDTMGVYGNYYLKRAIVAMIGLGANQPEDAIYPLNVVDADGDELMGEQNYVLHFASGQQPPSNAFWSITMYDADGFQIPNSINRFAVSSWMPLNLNPDGSLDIRIQHLSPGVEHESNWLPAPASGKMSVTMRIYAPKAEALNGDWSPPAIRKA